MKKNQVLVFILFLSGLFLSKPLIAAAYNVHYPDNQEFKKAKTSKKEIKNLKKQFKEEMRGMSKAEKNNYIEDKIKNENFSLPRKQLLIIGAILILAGIVFYFLPFIWFLGAILQSIGFIILVIWLILWLMDMA
jgi:hypothetical protein